MQMGWRFVASMAIAAGAACGGGSGAAGGGADAGGAARGAPPEQHDTLAAAVDSNPTLATDTIAARDTTTRVHVVNTGTRGMAFVVRWLLSPDQQALVVVEDPVGVEAEPVPDAFLYASERTGAVVQVDGVWDVTPSPDWTRLAFARAFVFRSGESESIPAAEWQRFFRWLPEDVAERTTAAMQARAERYAFPVSGMSYARAMALTQVFPVASLPAGRIAVVEAPTVRLEGWRVRWTPSGDTLAVGAAPAMVMDDADATRWTYVATRRVRSYHDSIGVAPPARRFAASPWIIGPTIDISIPFDLARERHIPALGATVSSANGRIRVERRGAVIDVGPGAALATTRDGRFIAALRPRAGAGEFDHPVEAVVYEVRS